MLLGTGAMQGASILNFIAFARLLEQAEFGSLRQMYLLNQLLFALVFAALPTSLLYFYGRSTSPSERGAALRSHFQIVVLLSLFITTVLVLFPGQIAQVLGNPRLAPWIPLFSAYPALYFLQNFVPAIMVAVERASLLTRFTFSIAVINSVPPITVAFVTGSANKTLVAIVVCAAISGVAAILTIAFLVSTHKIFSSKQAVPMRVILKYVGLLTVASGLTMVGLRVDQLVVSRTFGPAIFAIYVVGAFEIPLFGILQSSVSAVLLPKLAALQEKGDWEAIRNVWRDAVRRMGNIVLPLAAVLVVFSREIVVAIFGKDYSESAVIFAIFALLAPIRSVSFGLMLRASGRSQYDALGAGAFLVSSIVLCITFGAYFGYVGVAVGMVMSVVFVALLLSVFVNRVTGGEVRFFDLMPATFLVKFLVLLMATWAVRQIAYFLFQAVA
jgi:O-antigen/teichoic acid export membrane protein